MSEKPAKKILIIVPRLASISETFIYDQITGLKNYDAIVCCNQRQNQDLFILAKDPVVLGTKPKDFYDRVRSKIQRIFRRKKEYTFAFSAEQKIKAILRDKKNNIGLIHCHYGLSAIAIMPIMKEFNIPVVVTFHGYDASTMLNDQTYCIELKNFFRLNAYSITVSKDMENRLLDYNLKKDKNRVISCGIDTDFFFAKTEEQKNEPIVLLHSGRVVLKKGVLDLVKVFNEILNLNVVLWIIGEDLGADDGEYEQVQKYVNENGLKERITLFGGQPREKVREKMRESDVFILNSRTSRDGDMEGLPVSILEAMACGLPVISTYHSGIPEIIHDGIDGLLVPEFDNNQLKKAIVSLVEDAQLRKKLGANALIRSKDFSKIKVMQKIEECYRTILENEGV